MQKNSYKTELAVSGSRGREKCLWEVNASRRSWRLGWEGKAGVSCGHHTGAYTIHPTSFFKIKLLISLSL